MRSRTVLTALLALVCTGLAPVPSVSAAALCGSRPRCHVVARTDVDGDRRPDTVAIARRGADGAQQGRATVLVRTARARDVVSAARSTFFWTGPLWQGSTPLDGKPGRELVLGASAGAHTRYFWVLTWRDGRLLTLRAPRSDRTWVVDSAAMVVLGWQRSAVDPPGLVRQRIAERRPSGRLVGSVTTYRWDGARGWSRVRSRVVDPVTRTLAGRWAGWRVPGLDNY